ncbi:hypothetical protein DICVIV_08829 [Dictyocaulus viviparus]|uniref:Uncharacterized protein n=1 Tax=Dictyocaulus viviparus TaxID=29172 RepID=A0A0D8XMV1_DICVI|nr:hypothetical protein DICVIV_08829 [Dictyocaulus viviparus]
MLELLLQLFCIFGSMCFMCLCAQPKEEKSQGRMPINNRGTVLEQKSIGQSLVEGKQKADQECKNASKLSSNQKLDQISKQKSRADGVSNKTPLDGSVPKSAKELKSINDAEATSGMQPENMALLAAAEQMALDKADYDNFGPPGKPEAKST